MTFFSPLKPVLKTVPFTLIAATILLGSSCASFACRVQAFMAPKMLDANIQKQVNTFIENALVHDSNSLKRESDIRKKKDGRTATYDIEDLSGYIRKYGNKDGWGVVGYPCKTPQDLRVPQVTRHTEPAVEDRKFAPEIVQTLSNQPNIVMAHVRQASPEYKQVVVENVHPFTFHNWSWMHNGGVSGAYAPEVLNRIKAEDQRLDGGPKGTTDTERVFYYFLSTLLKHYETTDSTKLSTEQVQNAFSETMRDVIAHSKRGTKTLEGDIMGIGGIIQTTPSCNFILSDGNRLLVFRRVMNLYLGQKTLSSGGKIYIVSSEKSPVKDKTIQWLSLPENHILTLVWDKDGNPSPSLLPLDPLQ